MLGVQNMGKHDSSKSKLSYPDNDHSPIKCKDNWNYLPCNLISILKSKISWSTFYPSASISMLIFKKSMLKYPLPPLIWSPELLLRNSLIMVYIVCYSVTTFKALLLKTASSYFRVIMVKVYEYLEYIWCRSYPSTFLVLQKSCLAQRSR